MSDRRAIMHRRDLLKATALAAAAASVAGNLGISSAESAETGAVMAASNTGLPTNSVRWGPINELVARYLAIWNERTSERRRELVASTWTEDGTYIDAHRHGAGHDELDRMIETAQQHFPGYRLALVTGIEAHNGYVRFSWAAGGSPEAPLYIAGTDFAEVANDGRLKSAIGFVDAAPAAVSQ
jgi:hypothetical protein